MSLLPAHSRNLPAAPPLVGRVVEDEPTPGKYGHAEIAGIQFALTKIELRLGAIIFECTLMRAAPYAFEIGPGTPAKIYGTDGQLVADYGVPGTSGMPVCRVRPGDQCTVFLPMRISDIQSASPEDRRTFDNTMTVH